ncbi:hypothetical protein ABH945_000003 [Paraburkholderia sp. GAS333]
MGMDQQEREAVEQCGILRPLGFGLDGAAKKAFGVESIITCPGQCDPERSLASQSTSASITPS